MSEDVFQDEYRTIKSMSGVLKVHKDHGTGELEENITIARYFTDKYGHEIYLLPRYKNQKSPDAQNLTLNQIEEYKHPAEATKTAIDNALRDANRKADTAVLLVTVDFKLDILSRGIKGRIKQCKKLKRVVIIKDGKDVTYTKEEILAAGWKANWTDLK